MAEQSSQYAVASRSTHVGTVKQKSPSAKGQAAGTEAARRHAHGSRRAQYLCSAEDQTSTEVGRVNWEN